MEHYLIKRRPLRCLSKYNDGVLPSNNDINVDYFTLNGHLSLIKLLPNKNYSIFSIINGIIIGRLDIVKWFHNFQKNKTTYFNDNMFIYKQMVINSIVYEHLHILKWLYKNNYIKSDNDIIEIITDRPITNDISNWLIENNINITVKKHDENTYIHVNRFF
jgi:hypothetical protein